MNKSSSSTNAKKEWNYSRIINLREMGLSWKEIGVVVGIPYSKAKELYGKARHKAHIKNWAWLDGKNITREQIFDKPLLDERYSELYVQQAQKYGAETIKRANEKIVKFCDQLNAGNKEVVLNLFQDELAHAIDCGQVSIIDEYNDLFTGKLLKDKDITFQISEDGQSVQVMYFEKGDENKLAQGSKNEELSKDNDFEMAI